MTRFLLDSSIASDYINKRGVVFERAKTEVAKGNPVGIALPVLAELAYGIEKSRSRERNMRALQAALPSWRLWPFDRPAAFEFGRIYAELESSGRTMQIVDMMIAAIALTLGQCTVVTKGSDLSAVRGLTVESWANESPS